MNASETKLQQIIEGEKQYVVPLFQPNGVFVEVNLSADSIQKFCYQAIDAIGLTSDDWRVETR